MQLLNIDLDEFLSKSRMNDDSKTFLTLFSSLVWSVAATRLINRWWHSRQLISPTLSCIFIFRSNLSHILSSEFLSSLERKKKSVILKFHLHIFEESRIKEKVFRNYWSISLIASLFSLSYILILNCYFTLSGDWNLSLIQGTFPAVCVGSSKWHS